MNTLHNIYFEIYFLISDMYILEYIF